ncbi:helix-turn-helix domain-containing protein [Streptococcus hillyeri]|uniref:Helix-turn-helix domain-containing protein n=1 Tax=Streptococcus hillyeri TaxID=2282420 RepID=A0A3L9DZD9_9STRE|nr:S24 family peptidase [Streptococcus hillyeri]RLY04482.1 helix-turn-helix domain-containing protein [Streptococcus hillyeri]
MEIAERLKQLRLKAGFEQAELASQLGYKSDSTISKWESGKTLPTGRRLSRLAELLNTSTDYILYGQENQSPQLNTIFSQLEKDRKEKVIDFAQSELDEQIRLSKPRFEYKVYEKLSAGGGFSYYNDGNYDSVFYEEELDHDFASWIFGDSMNPVYLNGEVALIKQTGFDYDGAVYAVDWDGQTYIKKVYREEDGLRLVSLNPKYKDKFAPYDEDPRIIGIIVGHFMPMEV